MVGLLMLLMSPVESAPAQFVVTVDVNRGVYVSLFMLDEEIEAGKLYVIPDMTEEVSVPCRAVYYNGNERVEFFFKVDLKPGYKTTQPIKVRANPSPIYLTRL